MTARAYIGILNADQSVDAVLLLRADKADMSYLKNYNTEEKVRALIANGDIQRLTVDGEIYSNAQIKPRLYSDGQLYIMNAKYEDCKYAYLFVEGEWRRLLVSRAFSSTQC